MITKGELVSSRVSSFQQITCNIFRDEGPASPGSCSAQAGPFLSDREAGGFLFDRGAIIRIERCMSFPTSSKSHQWKAVGKVEKQHHSVRTALGYRCFGQVTE